MEKTTASEKLHHIKNRIKSTCAREKRCYDDVQLIAVSKTMPVEKVAPLIAAGQRLFGENRVQEALLKWPALKKRTPDLELHFLGPLQSNKVTKALGLFDVIHSLDRLSVVKAIANARGTSSGANNKVLQTRFFIQVNTGEEPQKSGILPRELKDFVELCRTTYHLPIIGLMTIPPRHGDPSHHFSLLEKLAKSHNLPCLSMGMSDDFETALTFGATHIRLGRSIFGQRLDQRQGARTDAP